MPRAVNRIAGVDIDARPGCLRRLRWQRRMAVRTRTFQHDRRQVAARMTVFIQGRKL
jgi:hypothetical protein